MELNNLTIHLHAGLHRGGSQGRGDCLRTKEHGIHHRHPGEALLQLG